MTDLADIVSSPEFGGEVVVWGDRTSSGVWCRAGTLSNSIRSSSSKYTFKNKITQGVISTY